MGIPPIERLEKETDVETGKTFALTVDYGKSLEQMIAAGRYEYGVHSDINAERFRIRGTGTVKVEAKLFHFGTTQYSMEVPYKLMDREYRPANIAELLAFGAAFPEIPRGFWVVALGSRTELLREGFFYVPCLRGDSTGRGLGVQWETVPWKNSCRFLAVREVS